MMQESGRSDFSVEKYDSLLLLGDISLNNEYIKLHYEKAKPFSGLKEYLGVNSFKIGNLECLCEGHDGENELKKPRLKTTYNTLDFLTDVSLNCVTVAHNHVYDNLLSGFNRTTEKLEELGIDYIGATTYDKPSKDYFSRVLIINDVKVGLLNYVTEDTNPCLPSDCKLMLSTFNHDDAVKHINQLKLVCDFVVLLMHWGGKVEHSYYPDSAQISIAHSLIDAGANVIIGHHSHTVQPIEPYKGGLVFYSLGNFCFSDIVFGGKTIHLDWGRNSESLIVRLYFTENAISYDLTTSKNSRNFINIDQNLLLKFKFRSFVFKYLLSVPWFLNIYHTVERKLYPIYRHFFGTPGNYWNKIVYTIFKIIDKRTHMTGKES